MLFLINYTNGLYITYCTTQNDDMKVQLYNNRKNNYKT